MIRTALRGDTRNRSHSSDVDDHCAACAAVGRAPTAVAVDHRTSGVRARAVYVGKLEGRCGRRPQFNCGERILSPGQQHVAAHASVAVLGNDGNLDVARFASDVRVHFGAAIRVQRVPSLFKCDYIDYIYGRARSSP